jgi:hypothetical protein
MVQVLISDPRVKNQLIFKLFEIKTLLFYKLQDADEINVYSQTK